jgi:hypothetical protein
MGRDGVVRPNKSIRLSGHARDQLAFRGATEQEVVEAIQTEPWRPAESGRVECRKDFAFNAIWNRKHYATKRVRPIFVEEPDEIVVVTIYVYYF